MREKSSAADGAAEKAAILIEAASPLIDLTIAGPFKHFTLHNRDHSKKLLHLSEYLITGETMRQLSILDHLVVVYAAYLHDLGMSLTEKERARIVESTEFLDATSEWQELWDPICDARARLQTVSDGQRASVEAELYQLHEAALANYLRPRHATPERYHELIDLLRNQTNRPDLFEFRGVSFADLLTEICVSHNSDVGVLVEAKGPYEERFPRKFVAGGAYLNAQFCAAILRLSDIMDFDRERTPRVLFESLGIQSRSLPGADLSLLEWQKHMSVHTLEINKDEIVVSADCRHPVIEKTIREFCQMIEREIRDTVAVLRRNPHDIAEAYQLEMPISVRPQVRSIGYTYKDMSLSLNQPRIMSLLMGEKLYATPSAAVRELIQNSIDACSTRLQMDGGAYHPDIKLCIHTDIQERRWLQISDNGCGMDEHVLSEYFLKLGNSYYRSPEFGRLMRTARNKGHQFSPISRFGIGIASAFLIGDILEVRTQSAHSPREDYQCRVVRLERLGALVFLTECPEGASGTLIKIRLLQAYNDSFEQFAGEVSSYLKNRILRPRFPVEAVLGDRKFTLCIGSTATPQPQARELLASKALELVTLDISRWSDRFTGAVYILFEKRPDGKLSHLSKGQYLRIGSHGISPSDILADFTGNRITVNGFAMNLKKLSRILGNGKNRLAMLLDFDIRGDDEIQYDISRDRIVGSGAPFVRTSLQMAIYEGLRDTGILDRLAPETLHVVDTAVHPKIYEADEPLNPELLESVLKLVPEGHWPKRIDRLIASELQTSRALVRAAIRQLVNSGRLKKPS
ncbi:MAG TPA: ATP-binding protein [Candidatus Acidoferrales bacterium]|nr:ATP-binding protein [Candidatus Acidoferrales bacterium]